MTEAVNPVGLLPGTEFRRVPYTCQKCKRARYAKAHASCGVDWLEKLHGLLVCDPCHDDLLLIAKEQRRIYTIEAAFKNGYTIRGHELRALDDQQRKELHRSLAQAEDRLKTTTARMEARKVA